MTAEQSTGVVGTWDHVSAFLGVLTERRLPPRRRLKVPPPARPPAAKVVLRIITGRGKHSRGDPKVLPIVREWLDAAGLSYQEGLGFFDVELAPPEGPLGPAAAPVSANDFGF